MKLLLVMSTMLLLAETKGLARSDENNNQPVTVDVDHRAMMPAGLLSPAQAVPHGTCAGVGADCGTALLASRAHADRAQLVGAPAPKPQIGIILRVVNAAGAEPKTLERARREAITILAHAGVELDWLVCEDGLADWSRQSPCQTVPGPTDFWLRIELRRPRGADRDALGWTEIDTVQDIAAAGIFYPAVEEVARRHRAETYQVLAAAISHEIGHLLLGGTRAHAPQGVMVGQWRASEIELISIGELRLTSGQARQLRDEIKRRTEPQK